MNLKEFCKNYNVSYPEKSDAFILCKELSTSPRNKMVNNNVMVIGGANSGKTRYFVEPNIMQANGSYIIEDSVGTLYNRYKDFLTGKGYKVKILDPGHPGKSNHYNPFSYIKSSQEIERLVDVIFKNTVSNNGGKDPFWDKAERSLLTAVMAYLYDYAPMEHQTFSEVFRLLKMAEIDEKDPSKKTELDILFEEAEAKDGGGYAVVYYKTFRMVSAGNTMKAIVISCMVRLRMFYDEEMAAMTDTDDIGLDELGNEKTALFVEKAKGDSEPKTIQAILYSQFIGLLLRGDGRHPVHINLFLDDLNEAGVIPDLGLLTTVSRKYDISTVLTFSSLETIRRIYEKDWELLSVNCDKIINMGGIMDFATAMWFRQILDNDVAEAAFIKYNEPGTITMIKNKSSIQLKEDECLVVLRSQKTAIKGKKYMVEDHPAWPVEAGAYTDSNEFIGLINDTEDVQCLADAILDGQPSKPENWEKAEKMLLCAVLEYQRLFLPDNMKNLDETLNIIQRDMDEIFLRLSPASSVRKFYSSFAGEAGEVRQGVITDVCIQLAGFKPEKEDLEKYWKRRKKEPQAENKVRTTVDGREIKDRDAAIEEIDKTIENLKRLRAALLEQNEKMRR